VKRPGFAHPVYHNTVHTGAEFPPLYGWQSVNEGNNPAEKIEETQK